jgi:hypothetical protein
MKDDVRKTKRVELLPAIKDLPSDPKWEALELPWQSTITKSYDASSNEASRCQL